MKIFKIEKNIFKRLTPFISRYFKTTPGAGAALKIMAPAKYDGSTTLTGAIFKSFP